MVSLPVRQPSGEGRAAHASAGMAAVPRRLPLSSVRCSVSVRPVLAAVTDYDSWHAGHDAVDAATVFADPLFKLVEAVRGDEARFAVIGFDAGARLLFVVHVEMLCDVLRIISARPATRSEEADYAR